MPSLRLYRSLVVFAVAAIAVTAVMARPAHAGRGGKVRGTGLEKCAVTPNPVNQGSQYWVNGSGFAPGISVQIQVGGSIFFGTVDASGHFSAWDWATFLYTGTKTVQVSQMGDPRVTVLASCTFWANGVY